MIKRSIALMLLAIGPYHDTDCEKVRESTDVKELAPIPPKKPKQMFDDEHRKEIILLWRALIANGEQPNDFIIEEFGEELGLR